MATPNIVPRADSEGGLGTASKYWASAYIDAIVTGALTVSSRTSGDATLIIESDTDNNAENDNPQLQFKQDGGNTIAKLGLTGDAGTIFTNSLANAAYFGNDALASVQLYTNATARLTINESGKVGIGTTSPQKALDISAAITAGGGVLRLSGTGNGSQNDQTGAIEFFSADTTDNSPGVFAKIRGVAHASGGEGSLQFVVDMPSEGADASTIAMHVNPDGKVGVGVIAPASLLHVAGTVQVGVDDTGHDVKFFGATASVFLHWDESADRLIFTDNAFLAIGSSSDLLVYHDASNSHILNSTGNLNITNNQDNGGIIFATDNGSGGTTTYMDINGGDEYIYVYKQFNVRDNVLLTIGNSNDLQIYHDASNSYIKDTGTGDLRIMAGNAIQFYDAGTAETLAVFNSNGSIDLYHNNVKKFETTATGVQIGASSSAKANPLSINHAPTAIASLTTSNNGTAWNTSSAIMLEGASNSNGLGFGVSSTANDRKSYIQSGHPAQSAASSLGTLLLNPLGGSVGIGTISPASLLHVAGTVQVGVDDTGHDVKFFGATSGKFLQWDESADTLFLTDNTNITFGNGNDATIGVASDNLVIKNDTADKDIIFQSDDGSGGVATYFFLDGSQANTSFQKDIIFGDGKKALFGGSGDLQIYHDGSNSYIADTGTGTLNISGSSQVNINAANGENGVQVIENAGVKLRHNNVVKLETTGTGISVAGAVASTFATGNAAGAGFNTSGTVAIDVGEINGEIITTIKVDIGTGAILSSGTAGDVIGEDDTEGAFLTRITTAVNGIVYRGEMICVEVPTTGDADINLAANSSATLAEDGAGEGEHVLIDGGTATLAKHYPSFTIPSGGIQNDHLYLTHGGTTAGTYGAGQFIIKLYGAAVVS